MKLFKLYVIVFCLLCLFSEGYAQHDRVIKEIIRLGQTENLTMNHLDVLTNRIGGRITGSDAYDNAVKWCAEQFKKWGMEVILDEVGTLPVGFNRGPWFGRMLSEDGMILHFATPSYTAGTKGVQRGHVLMEPKTRAEFERIKGALKGAWVLITGTNNGWPIDWSATGDSIRAKIIEENEEIERKNREIAAENRKKPESEQQPLIPLKDEPALFYKEMREAGILGIIQSSAVPIRALY
ncbi:MAG TPA: peptidase M28, partial [Bacteroidales bacterium]|nr:peptidase M28 [Bacteroidales bacterium]